MKRKRFLFILPFFPWPLVSGGHQGIFNSIRAVRDYADIHLVYYAGQRDVAGRYHAELMAQIGGHVEIHPYVDRPVKWTRSVAFRKIGNKLFKRADHLSYLLFTKLHDAGYYDFVNGLIRSLDIDLVQAEMVETLDFILALPETVKRVFVHHELRFVRNAQFLTGDGADSYRKALCEEEKIKEIALLNRYDLILTVSQVDRQKLLEAGVTAPVHASFSIVNSYAGQTGSHEASHRVTYVGPESHYPNKLGLMWFLDNVWPLVKQRDPGFRMEIIGKWSAGTEAEWTKRYKDVHFSGFVDDLSSALRGSTMVVPVFVGSGIRMKILEAMSYGIPFVSTVVGAEGIPVEDGVHGFITDEPAAFAEGLLKAEDPQLRKLMASNGQRLLDERYSAQALARNKKAAYESLLGVL